MSSSPTLSAESSTVSPLWTAFQAWEASVSSPEKNILMAGLISTCSAISDGSLEVERLIYSMYSVTTQTLTLLEAHQRRDTITQSRMATLSAEASRDRRPAELEIARLIRSGLRLRVRRIETSFGNWFMCWIPKVQRALSDSCRNTVTGNSLLLLPHMHRQPELNSMTALLMEDLIGYNNLAWEVDNHS